MIGALFLILVVTYVIHKSAFYYDLVLIRLKEFSECPQYIFVLDSE